MHYPGNTSRQSQHVKTRIIVALITAWTTVLFVNISDASIHCQSRQAARSTFRPKIRAPRLAPIHEISRDRLIESFRELAIARVDLPIFADNGSRHSGANLDSLLPRIKPHFSVPTIGRSTKTDSVINDEMLLDDQAVASNPQFPVEVDNLGYSSRPIPEASAFVIWSVFGVMGSIAAWRRAAAARRA
jgi:hypothetical protein